MANVEAPYGKTVKWVVCGKCGHKLMRIMHESEVAECKAAFEIKCFSCKELNLMEIDIIC